MQHLDWQTLVTMAIGAAAAVYLARRWWPGLKGLVKPQPPANAPSPISQDGCGISGSPNGAASCGHGCGNCGQSSTSPAKDHRRVIHIHQD